MLRSSTLLTSTATLALLAGPALADVTAAEVWQNLSAPYSAMGLTISSTATDAGGIITHDDIALNFSLPMGLGGGTLTLPPLALIENGDGTVTISYPDEMTMEFSGFITGEGSVAATVRMATDGGTDMLATGTPGDITYTGTSGNVTMALTDIAVDGQPMDMFSLSMDIQSTGTVTQRIVEGDLVQITADITSGPSTTAVEMALVDPFSGTVNAEMTGASPGGTIHIDAALPAGGSDLLNLAPALAQGLSIAFQSDTLGNEQRQLITDTLGIVVSDQTTASGPSTADFRFDADGLMLDATVEQIVVEMIDPTIPFPINFDIANMAATIGFPLTARAEPQDFVLRTTLDDLRLGPAIWDLVDPTKAMDRAPADLSLDLTGTTILSADLTNFLQLGMMMDQGITVATVEEVQLRDLQLGALGATAQATAAFTLDNSDTTTYFGFPKPVGGLSFTIEGLNAALDQLVAAGMIPQEELFGMRMMMGMVAQSSGDDTMSGTIQLGEDGSITANGQRLR